jgi:hypothetical protein
MTLSHSSDDWAKFGEFTGGSLGALYGFLAFVGVLITIQIQRSQSRLDELQRLMAMVCQRIDSLFDSPLSQVEPDVRKRIEASGQSITTFTALSALGVAAVDDHVPNREELLGRGTANISHEAHLIVIELQQLVLLIQAYATGGGENAIRAFYQSRYVVPVAWLQGISLLSSEIVEKHFRAQAYLDDMRNQISQARGGTPWNPKIS